VRKRCVREQGLGALTSEDKGSVGTDAVTLRGRVSGTSDHCNLTGEITECWGREIACLRRGTAKEARGNTGKHARFLPSTIRRPFKLKMPSGLAFTVGFNSIGE